MSFKNIAKANQKTGEFNKHKGANNRLARWGLLFVMFTLLFLFVYCGK